MIENYNVGCLLAALPRLLCDFWSMSQKIKEKVGMDECPGGRIALCRFWEVKSNGG